MPLADPAILADANRLAALRETGLLDSPLEEAFERWTRLAAQLLGVPTTLISLVDDHRQFFKSAVGLGEPWASRRETPLTHSFCQHAVATGETLSVDDARVDPLLHDNLAVSELGVIAYAGAPLKSAEGYTLGVLCALDGKPRHWTAQELATLEALAKSVMNEITLRTIALRLARSESQARRQALLLRTIVDQMESTLVAVDLRDEVLLANERALRLRDAHEDGALKQFAADGTPIEWTERPIARAIRGEVLRDVQIRQELQGRPPRWVNVNARPLRDEHGLQIGALSESRDVTALVAAHEKLQSLNERLREQSHADELTGLYNRRGFMTLSEQELKVARRTKRTALVFYVDLDGLKQINDRLGHQAGDAALLEAASVLRSTFRDSDVPARMGGDEFAVFAHETSEEGARALEVRLQENVAEANREHHRPFRLAMSAGWALFDPEQPEPLTSLITRADAAMYANKRRRREKAQASI